jgi:very-short-patch-repair endonuclease
LDGGALSVSVTFVKKHPPSRSIENARKMRREPTDAEAKMWSLLRECFPQARFRRQVPLRQYIVDFASHSLRLVVEIDGGQHSPAKDAVRTSAIEAEGYRIVRFWNNEVLGNPDGCMTQLSLAVGALGVNRGITPTQPSPIKGEGFRA